MVWSASRPAMKIGNQRRKAKSRLKQNNISNNSCRMWINRPPFCDHKNRTSAINRAIYRKPSERLLINALVESMKGFEVQTSRRHAEKHLQNEDHRF
jgi:hypothetical protein